MLLALRWAKEFESLRGVLNSRLEERLFLTAPDDLGLPLPLKLNKLDFMPSSNSWKLILASPSMSKRLRIAISSDLVAT